MKNALLLLAAFACGCFVLSGCKKAEPAAGAAPEPEDFIRVMNTGKNYYDKGDAGKAIEAFERAVKLGPTQADAHLNLANAYLLKGESDKALKEAQEAAALDKNSPGAGYVAGCALLRLQKWEEALKELQRAKDLDPNVGAVAFQLGQAHMQLKHFEDAVREFQAAVDLEPQHPAAHYALSQALIRVNRQDEAAQQLELHRQINAKQPGMAPNPANFERCVYTQIRVPFRLEQPAREGIKVAFSDQTAKFFGANAGSYAGPFGVIDINHRGASDLFIHEPAKGFRLLLNTNGAFEAAGNPLPGIPGAKYYQCLVGDLQNDRFEDVVVLGDKGSHAFKFATNGVITDLSVFSRVDGLQAVDGALVDFDFTGKLDLIAVSTTNTVRLLRNLGNMYFKDITSTSGIPANLQTAQALALDDWNNDDLMDVFVLRKGEAPALLAKQRGGLLTATNPVTPWAEGSAIASGDLDNDLRTDVIIATAGKIEISLANATNRVTIPTGPDKISKLLLLDYDNDGWLDIWAFGDKTRVWRNAGQAGFIEQTAALGLDKIVAGKVSFAAAADFDNDCDTDLLIGLENGGLQLLRNDGGNANHQLKMRLMGNRSNASGLGIRVEAIAGGWHTLRTVGRLPVEIGVGTNTQLEAMTVRWFDLAMNMVDIKVDCSGPLVTSELILPTGSCPYMYAWDGAKFRFVTDILGASPIGLPAAEGVYIDADMDEHVWIGNEQTFKPKGSNYVVQLTEELREVLYLDQAALYVVDHPPGVEVHPTDKLVPGKPFPPSSLMPLEHRKDLRKAVDAAGGDVTDALVRADGKLFSPPQLRIPQLRGLAEPYSVTLDFGPLDPEKPLVLAMTGWLRFGGGMANIAASQNPDLPFPFPKLDVQVEGGEWRPLDIVVGAPAGKTKTILVDLSGKLPAGARLLRWSSSFEIHWDRIALFEKANPASITIQRLAPSGTDLHWRGFSEMADLPWTQPLTPAYDRVRQTANWRITPTGWCTRYGKVDPLVRDRDDALVLLNGGDELTLEFAASAIQSKKPGMERDFFLFTDGWDKDADFHVAQGWRVEPLPYHGMNDQAYGSPTFPVRPSADWMIQYNTRFVSPLTLERKAARAGTSMR